MAEALVETTSDLANMVKGSPSQYVKVVLNMKIRFLGTSFALFFRFFVVHPCHCQYGEVHSWSKDSYLLAQRWGKPALHDNWNLDQTRQHAEGNVLRC